MSNIEITFRGSSTHEVRKQMSDFMGSTPQLVNQEIVAAEVQVAVETETPAAEEPAPAKKKAAPKKSKKAAPYEVRHLEDGQHKVTAFEDVADAVELLVDTLRNCETMDEYSDITTANQPLAQRLTKEKNDDAMGEVKRAVAEVLATLDSAGPTDEDAGDLMGDEGDAEITMDVVKGVYTEVINTLGIPKARELLDGLGLGEGVKIKEIPVEHLANAHAVAVAALAA